MARNDLMTALLDTRRALEENVAALGERVETARREVTETVTSQISDLHADNRETRNRVNSAATSVAEINRSLPGIRQEITELAHTVNSLRTVMESVLAGLPAPPDRTPTPGDPDPVPLFDTGAVPAPEDTEAVAARDAAGDARAATPAEPSRTEAAAQREAATEVPPDTEESPVDDPSAHRAGAAGDDTARGFSLARHDRVLASAATVGTVHLVCHRDLWDFVQEHAADVPHFRLPATPAEEGHDRLRITLSGRSVIGVLIAMRDTSLNSAAYGKDDGAWTLSCAVYDRLAHDLTTTSRTGGVPLTVVFDDGTTPPADTTTG